MTITSTTTTTTAMTAIAKIVTPTPAPRNDHGCVGAGVMSMLADMVTIVMLEVVDVDVAVVLTNVAVVVEVVVVVAVVVVGDMLAVEVVVVSDLVVVTGICDATFPSHDTNLISQISVLPNVAIMKYFTGPGTANVIPLLPCTLPGVHWVLTDCMPQQSPLV